MSRFMPVAFVSEPPLIELEHGLFQLDFMSGQEIMPMVMTPHVLAMFVRNANRALDSHFEQRSVVEFQPKGKRTRK